MKLQNSQDRKILPLSKNVPLKYQNCPDDLTWAIPLSMNQETQEFQNWISPHKIKADQNAANFARQSQKNKFQIIK